MAASRTTTDKQLISGRHSVRNAALKTVLREIDWALATESTKFSSCLTRRRAYRDLAALELTWKVESAKYRDKEVNARLVPYDGQNIQKIATAAVSYSNKKSRLHATANRLHSEGSRALSAIWLGSIGYDSEEEVRITAY